MNFRDRVLTIVGPELDEIRGLFAAVTEEQLPDPISFKPMVDCCNELKRQVQSVKDELYNIERKVNPNPVRDVVRQFKRIYDVIKQIEQNPEELSLPHILQDLLPAEDLELVESIRGLVEVIRDILGYKQPSNILGVPEPVAPGITIPGIDTPQLIPVPGAPAMPIPALPMSFIPERSFDEDAAIQLLLRCCSTMGSKLDQLLHQGVQVDMSEVISTIRRYS